MPNLIGEIVDHAVKKKADGGQYIELKVQVEGKDFPYTIRDFSDDLIANSFQKGDIVAVTFEEREGNYRGKQVTYRNLTDIQMDGGDPFPPGSIKDRPRPSAPEGRQTAQEGRSAPQRPHASQGSGAGWREPYSQSREAVEEQRASIEAQVALKEAWAAVLDMGRVDKIDLLDEAEVAKHLDLFTLQGLAAMRKARNVMGQGGR